MEPDAAPKALPNGRKERENDREHGIGNLLRQRQKFNGISQYGVFGRDTHPFSQFDADYCEAALCVAGRAAQAIAMSSSS